MPQLPSGRYIGIHCLGGAEIIRKYSDTHPEASLLTLGIEIAEMDSIEELPSYISILFLRESNSPTDMSLDSRSQSIPTDAEPYASGFTLADQSIFTADWPEEDKRAFAEFLQSERVARYFEDNLKQVIRVGKWYQENLQAMMDEVCGADDTGDKAVPTVHEFGEELGVPMIRINPTDAKVNRTTDVSLEMGALDGIAAIAKKLVEMGFVKKAD